MRFALGVLLGLALAYGAHEWIVRYSKHGLPPNYEVPKGFVKTDGILQWWPSPTVQEDAA